MKKSVINFAYLLTILYGCQTTSKKNMETNNNPLLCNPDSGICEIPMHNDSSAIEITQSAKPIKIVYFTDPICSSCWGIEPQLRKLKLEYGNTIEIEYRMGGLLPDWSYNSGGISKPSDVAGHWGEVSHYYDMPIDGDVWLQDPLQSSYPPSIAFKAAEFQSKEKSLLFLREMREMVFLKKKNIAKWEVMAEAAKAVGLNVEQLKTDYEGRAKTAFDEDLKLARQYNVRGFPTLFFQDSTGIKATVYGTKPYLNYESVIKQIKEDVIKTSYDKSWQSIFKIYHSLTAKEFSELSGIARQQCDGYLNDLVNKGDLKVYTTKNGSMWTMVK